MNNWKLFVGKTVKRYLTAKTLSKVTGKNVRVLRKNISLLKRELKQLLSVFS